MNDYIVLYRDETIMHPTEPPFAFSCQGDNLDHAEEQCLNAYPEIDIVWVFEGDDASAALSNYWEA